MFREVWNVLAVKPTAVKLGIYSFDEDIWDSFLKNGSNSYDHKILLNFKNSSYSLEKYVNGTLPYIWLL